MSEREYCPHCGKELDANPWVPPVPEYEPEPFGPPVDDRRDRRYLSDYLARHALSYAEIGATCTTASSIANDIIGDLPTRATNLPGPASYYRRSSVRRKRYRAVLTPVPKRMLKKGG